MLLLSKSYVCTSLYASRLGTCVRVTRQISEKIQVWSTGKVLRKLYVIVKAPKI